MRHNGRPVADIVPVKAAMPAWPLARPPHEAGANCRSAVYTRLVPSRRDHLEVDYLRYERDLRRLLRLTGSRKEKAA